MGYTQSKFSASTDSESVASSFIFASLSYVYKGHCFSPEQLERLQWHWMQPGFSDIEQMKVTMQKWINK